MASGWIHGPCTFARKTSGAPVTQKRAWMQRLVSNMRSSRWPGAVSMPFTTVGVATTGCAPLVAAAMFADVGVCADAATYAWGCIVVTPVAAAVDDGLDAERAVVLGAEVDDAALRAAVIKAAP